METCRTFGWRRKKCTFKSYYVVWKPKNTIAGKEVLIRFKSYYVVWKQEAGVGDTPTPESLNRTM